jgi:integrase
MRGYIRKRGKHSWQIAVRAGRDPISGKYVRVYRTVRGGRTVAERALARLLHEVATGGLVDPGRVTVGGWLDLWLHNIAKPNVAAKTLERYSEIVRLHLKPHLGKIPLHQLRPAHIQRLYAVLQEAGKHPRTILHVHRVLHTALERAVKLEVVGRNVCDAVSPPKVRPQEIPVVTEAELAKVLRASEGTRLHIPVLLAALCGLRRGEILALRWEDVDLDRGVLQVRRSLEEVRVDGQRVVRFKEPKTGKARAVVLPPLVVEALRRHRKAQLEERLRAGPDWKDHNLVCPATNGAPWYPSNFRKAFTDLVRRCGTRAFTFHQLRHTHASLAIRLGADVRTVAARLGHSSPTLTLNTYSHELPGAQEELALRVDRTIRQALQRAQEQS